MYPAPSSGRGTGPVPWPPLPWRAAPALTGTCSSVCHRKAMTGDRDGLVTRSCPACHFRLLGLVRPPSQERPSHRGVVGLVCALDGTDSPASRPAGPSPPLRLTASPDRGRCTWESCRRLVCGRWSPLGSEAERARPTSCWPSRSRRDFCHRTHPAAGPTPLGVSVGASCPGGALCLRWRWDVLML